ncbi:MAG TPA: peptide chain release factor aRF-1 [Candidatus Thermoplasmatota archaeon]|nr:peptide chain release factor aRF-1 [Candidatus Thermoplasmatota archaeon]
MAEGRNEQNSDRARYEFKRRLEELRNIRGSATQLISLYVPPGRQIHDVMAQLRSEYSQASNIKSKSTMKNVTGALESAMQALKNFKDPGENGLIIFVGHRSIGGEKTKMFNQVIVPPMPITLMKYHCDSAFFLEPLEAMLKEHNNYGLIVLDRQEATIGFLRGQAVQVVTNMQSMVPNKHAKGGQSARRFERITEDIADKWFYKIGETATEIFLPELEKGELKGVLVGGPGPTKEYWLQNQYMNHELHKRIIGQPIDTGYTDEYGLRDLVANAAPILRDFGLMEEKDIVNRFMREIGKPDGGLGSYGEAQVRNALTIGAVDTLILSEKLRKARLTMKCESCSWTKEETTAEDPLEFEKRYGPCPSCSQQTVAIDQEVDIVEELSQLAEATASKVRIISGGSDEGELFYKAFGGIGAILRFRVG